MAKYLLAVSGGPDSMFLLDQYKKKHIVVAHVNYHKRESSDHDEKIVRDFCAANNIPFFVKNVKEKSEGNFQAWARKVRYDFFADIYQNEQCTALLVAHHKDDFLESGMMQLETNRINRHLGIAEKSTINGMKVQRPLLHRYWKKQILKFLDEKKIKYGIDETNAEPIYARNAMRIKIDAMDKQEKRSRYDWLMMSNQILKKKYRKIDALYGKWQKTSFAVDFFCKQNRFEQEIVYELLTRNFQDFKISTEKLKSCSDFICNADGNKKYDLGKNNFLQKTNQKILVITEKK